MRKFKIGDRLLLIKDNVEVICRGSYRDLYGSGSFGDPNSYAIKRMDGGKVAWFNAKEFRLIKHKILIPKKRDNLIRERISWMHLCTASEVYKAIKDEIRRYNNA